MLTAVLCAIALAFVLRYYTETPRRVVSADEPRAPFTAILGLAGVLPLLVVLFLVNFIGRSFTPILPMQLGRLGVAREALASSTGLLISIYSICAAASAMLLGRASRTRPPRTMLVVALGGGRRRPCCRSPGRAASRRSWRSRHCSASRRAVP